MTEWLFKKIFKYKMYYAHLNSERGKRWKFKLSEKINNTVKVQLFKNSPLMGLEVWPSFSPQYLHHHHHGNHLFVDHCTLCIITIIVIVTMTSLSFLYYIY